MGTISFEQLPTAVADLTKQIKELKRLVIETKQQPDAPSDKFMTIQEASEFLKLSVPTIYSKVSRRELPYMKRGKRLYFSKFELTDFLKAGKVKSISELEAETDEFLDKKRRTAK